MSKLIKYTGKRKVEVHFKRGYAYKGKLHHIFNAIEVDVFDQFIKIGLNGDDDGFIIIYNFMVQKPVLITKRKI